MSSIVKKTRNKHSRKSKNNRNNFKQRSRLQSRHRKRSHLRTTRVMKRKTRRNLRGGNDDPVSYEEGNKYNFMLQAKKIQYKDLQYRMHTVYVLSDIDNEYSNTNNNLIRHDSPSYAAPGSIIGDYYKVDGKDIQYKTATPYITSVDILIEKGEYRTYFNNGDRANLGMIKITNSKLKIETNHFLGGYRFESNSYIEIDNHRILDFTKKPFKIVMFKNDRLFAVNKEGSNDDHLLYLDKIITNEDNITIHIIIFYPLSFTEKRGSISIPIIRIETYFKSIETQKEWFSIEMIDTEIVVKKTGNVRQFQFVSEDVMRLFIVKVKEIKEM